MVEKQNFAQLLLNKTNTKVVRIFLLCSLIITIALPRIFRNDEEFAIEKAAFLVQGITPEEVSEGATVTGYGTVEPSKAFEVHNQVSGSVVEMHKQLIEGGRINQGETLFKLDPREFQIAVDSKRAQVTRAESDLKIEQGNQVVAAREWKLFKTDKNSPDFKNDLALRLPQLLDKQAALASVLSDLKRAQLDLERTVVECPFPALVLESHVETGAFLTANSLAAKLASTDSFYIKARISESALALLSYDSATGAPTRKNKVKIIREISAGKSYVREGKLELIIGSVENEGRMAQALISIPDPMGGSVDSAPPILIGSYLKVEISGRTVGGAFKIPRSALREQNQIYVADAKNLLRIRRPDILYANNQAVVIKADLKKGDRVIISNIQTPLEGTKLRVQELLEAN